MTYLAEMQTLAQVAIGVAGFAGIVVAVRPHTEGMQGADYVRMRELVLASLGVVFFSFLPSIASGFAVNTAWAWQGCVLLIAFYHILLMTLFLGSVNHGDVIRFEWAETPVGVVVIAIQLAAGFGYLGTYIEGVYLLSLFWLLFVAAFNFAVVVLRRGAA
jgi:hypothetical protein